jgi:hypothetical protein
VGEKNNLQHRHSKRETERSGGSDLEPRFRVIEQTQQGSKSVVPPGLRRGSLLFGMTVDFYFSDGAYYYEPNTVIPTKVGIFLIWVSH